MASAPSRLGFAGTPEFAATILAALIEAGRTPAAVYTQPDRPTGRGRRLQPPPVKTLATEHSLPVRQPPSLRDPRAVERFVADSLEVLVVAAYGLILPPAVLSAPRFGCVNVHASLLPRWRGAAPVERAIMAGDIETGVSIMQMERGLDTGPVYLQKRCPITPETDGPTLESRLARLGAQALLECLPRLAEMTPTPQPDSGVTYAAKLTRADAMIHWTEPAVKLARQVRALCGRMPAFTEAGGVRKIVLEAVVSEGAEGTEGAGTARPGTVLAASAGGIVVACGEGALTVTRLRLSAGKGRPLSAADAVNGYPALFARGALFGEAGRAR